MSFEEKFSEEEKPVNLDFDGLNNIIDVGSFNFIIQEVSSEVELEIEKNPELQPFQEKIDFFNKKLSEYREVKEEKLRQAVLQIHNQEEILSRTPQIMETRTRMIDNLVKTSLEYALQQFNVLSPEDKKKFLDFVSVEAEDKEKILKKGTLTLNDFGAVVMMGGTGAGYLCPHSDLDIRFVPIEQNSWQEKMANSFLNVFFENVYDNGYIRMGNVYAPEQIQLSGELSRLYKEYSNSPANKNKFAELKDKILEVFEKTKIARNISSNKLRRLIDYFSQYARNRLLEGELFDFEEREKVEEEIRSEIKSENDFESMQNLFFAKIHSDKKICLKNNQIEGYLHSFEDYYSKNPTEYIFQSEMEIPKEFLDALNKPSSANSFREMLNEIKKFNSGVITDVFEHMSMRCACGNQTVFEKYKKDWLDLLLQSTEIESITFADLVKFIALAHMPEFPEIAEKEFDIKEDLLRRAQYYLTIYQIISGRIVARPTHEVLAQYYQNNVIPPEIFQEVHDSIIFLWYLRHLTSYVNKNEKNTINKDSILAIVRNSEICLKEKKEVLNLMLQAVNSRLPFLLNTILSHTQAIPSELSSVHTEQLKYDFSLQNQTLYFSGEIEEGKELDFLHHCLYYCALYQCKLDSKIQVKLYEIARTLVPKEIDTDSVQKITQEINLEMRESFDPIYVEKKQKILDLMFGRWSGEGISGFYQVYLWLANSGVISLIFPDLAKLKNLWSEEEQKYSSLFDETTATLQALAKVSEIRKFQELFKPVNNVLNYFTPILILATIFHDTGLCVDPEKNDNSPYLEDEHEKRSAEKFLEVATKMGLEKYVGGDEGIKKVDFLIRNSHTLFGQYGLDFKRADFENPILLDQFKEILGEKKDLAEIFLLFSMTVHHAKNPQNLSEKYKGVITLYDQYIKLDQVKEFLENNKYFFFENLAQIVFRGFPSNFSLAQVRDYLKAYLKHPVLMHYRIIEAFKSVNFTIEDLVQMGKTEKEKAILELIKSLDTNIIRQEMRIALQEGTYGEVYLPDEIEDYKEKHLVMIRMPDTADALMRFSIYLSFKGFSVFSVKSVRIGEDENEYLIEINKFDGENFKYDKLENHIATFCQKATFECNQGAVCANRWCLELINQDLSLSGSNFEPLLKKECRIEIRNEKKMVEISGKGDQKYILARMTYALYNAGLRIMSASLCTTKDGKMFRDVFVCDSKIPETVKDELDRALFSQEFNLEEMAKCLEK